MNEPVAIVGMGAVFPGAADLDAYWHNIERGVDAITDVPAARWEPVYFDPAAHAADRFYCRRGGFVDDVAAIDPVAFGIMPVAAQGAEPDQLLALHVAAAAIADAGAAGRALPRDRTGVILGRGGYLTPGMARLSQRVRSAQQLVTTLAELVPELDAATLDRVRAAFSARAGDLGPETAIGLVPNLAASRIANRLDLRGPAYTVDAACASSLLAVDQACRELSLRRCDAVIAGGVHVCHDVTFWSVFTQLGALSHAQAIRPFDRRADGILIGEGAGVVVLKRLADAERDGDRVYAVIRGAGVSSDGRESSAMRPRLEGQLAALADAWRMAELEPTTVGLVEAHGTGTPTGDEVELRALAAHFGEAAPRRARAVLGSVKSMIGHAMPAAGAAGLIKAALAVHHGVLPPSLHCEEPSDELARTRFRVIDRAEPWTAPGARTAGVSAFGFGGINAHVVLEQHAAAPSRSAHAVSAPFGAIPPRPDAAPRIAAFAAETVDALRAAVDAGTPGGRGPARLAMLDPTPERRALAAKVLARGKAWRGQSDIWFAPRGLAHADAEGNGGGQLAFLFPGIEVAAPPESGAIARHFDLPHDVAPAQAQGLERQGLEVFALGRLLARALERAGARPALFAGHSLGEWTGMVVSEMIAPADADRFVGGLAPGTLEVPDVVFAAVGCSAAGAAEAIADLDEIAVSHDNCPHQSIVCGRRDRVRAAMERLGARGVLCQELPFRSGFHSPLFASYLAPHRAHLAGLPLQRQRAPLWSATTCAPYPDGGTAAPAVRALAIDHLVQPVRFRELVERLYAGGTRAFVALGVGSLPSFVGDTLRGVEHLAIAASSEKHAPLSQLARVVAALYVEGWDVDVSLGESAREAAVARKLAPKAGATRGSMKLALGAPLITLDGAVAALGPMRRTTNAAEAGALTELAALRALAAPALLDSPVLGELAATLREAAAASQAVVDAWTRAKHAPPPAPRAYQPPPVAPTPAPPPPPRDQITRRTLSVDREPFLLDHCFYRQPSGWPDVADRYPVVPMTMMIELMLDAARALAPGLVAIAAEDVRAFRWLAVVPPAEIEIRAHRRDDAHDASDPHVLVDVELAGYARATVRFAARYPDAPAPRLPALVDARPTPVDAVHLYEDRWMFHGPRYAGVVEMSAMGDDGVDGVIETLPATGALLDCAGQLMGWWVMDHETLDRLAMPVHLARVEFFADHPAPGVRVGCRVRMRKVLDREVGADHELIDLSTGRLWCRIERWEDRRFDSDEPLWRVLQYPERHALAEPAPDGHGGTPYVKVVEHWRTVASRELVMRRYLGVHERVEHERVAPRGRRAWLLGRIALKDAVRLRRWAAGGAPLFPVEVEVAADEEGRAIVVGPSAPHAPFVSLSHKDDVAVAIVAARPVGIDIETIAPRTDAFVRISFSDAELALGAAHAGGRDDRDEWMARLWTAKEAVAKMRGTGMTDPRKLPVTSVAGDLLVVDGVRVRTRRDGAHVIAWTDATEGTEDVQ